ncbi:putative maleylacetate reductase [Leptodontidium sp. MPI-SDFR-AT-0119]|nr:putative maleylacetate reductase [Leptodontidium sp. MPI-SDFR-AT-0119]
MEAFEYNVSAARVIFGNGSVSKLAGEIAGQKLKAPLLLSTPEQVGYVSRLKKLLNGNIADVRSTIGLGKAISIRTGLPHICIPTTYADGDAEWSQDLTGTVIYDVDLTITLPASMSATSVVNAIAHAVTLEALYAWNTNPIISLLALKGVKSLAASLHRIVESPADVPGAVEGRLAYTTSACDSHHKLCHILGGSFNMPHAETHTIILPHALAYNSPAIPEVMKRLADVLPGSGGNAIKGLNVLLQSLKLKRGLKDFGFKEEDNPRAVEIGPIRELLRRAWAGEDARADF